MGIVVSGKDGNAVVSNEQHNVDLITAENDYGLILATLDQVLVFLGSWWTTSLTGRIQVGSVSDTLDERVRLIFQDLQTLHPLSPVENHKVRAFIRRDAWVLFFWNPCMGSVNLHIHLQASATGAISELPTRQFTAVFAQRCRFPVYSLFILRLAFGVSN